MTATSLGAELRRYRALANALVVTLIVSVALFVQFLRMENTRTEHAFSLSVAHAATNSGMQIAVLIERLEMIGRGHLLLGASDTQLVNAMRALDVDAKLLSLCMRQGDSIRVLKAAAGDMETTRERCSKDYSSTRTSVAHSHENILVTDLRIVSPTTPGGAPSPEFRMRVGGTRELRVTLSSTALLDTFVIGDSEPEVAAEVTCLSLLVEGSFRELACRGGELAAAAPERFAPSDAHGAPVVEKFRTAGLLWQVLAAPDPRVIAGTITPLPFLMFGAALVVGGAACVFAYLAVDKNLLLEAHTEELRARLEQLERLEERNEMLDQFAAMAAHDLQAPIRFIVSNAHLLVSELDELEQPEMSRMAMTQIEQGGRMRALVLDLLEFCRAGQGELAISSVDANTLVSDEVRLLKAREEYADTTIRVGPLPNALPCDAGKFGQVIRNLLGNAAKFSQASPAPNVSIDAGYDAHRKEWTFRVEDNGPGIDASHHERIFRPFSRLDADAEGTGMGLAIVKKMLERHRGKIWVDPDTTAGCSFCFTMPGTTPAEKSG